MARKSLLLFVVVCALLVLAPDTSAQACATPDPFTSIGGGQCINGGWRPKPAAAAPTPAVIVPQTAVVSFPSTVDTTTKGKLYVGTMSLDPIPCNGQDITSYWSNTYGVPIFIRKLRVWMGSAQYQHADIGAIVWVSPSDPPMPIFAHNWDRYGATSWHDVFESVFAPDYIEVPAGGWITYLMKCTIVEPSGVTGYGQQLSVFFTAVRP